MNNGIKIILERMKTNPEEFKNGAASLWVSAVNSWWDVLTPEEKDAYRKGLREIMEASFEQEVVKILLLNKHTKGLM